MIRAIIAITVVIGMLSTAALVRRGALRRGALQEWDRTSSLILGLTGTSARAWISEREGAARLLATSAAVSPRVFGIESPGDTLVTPQQMSAVLARALQTLRGTHPYSDLYVFDTTGRLVGSASGKTPPPIAIRAALTSLRTDSAVIAGPATTPLGDVIAIAQSVRFVPGKAHPSNLLPGALMGTVLLTIDPDRTMFGELAGGLRGPSNEMTALVSTSGDSIYEYALVSNRERAGLAGSWERSNAPALARGAVTPAHDVLVMQGDSMEFVHPVAGAAWHLVRRADASAVYAAADARLLNELGLAAALCIGIAWLLVARARAARVRQAREVAASETRYRLLAENATDVIARHTVDGRVRYVSPAVRSMLGYVPAELHGKRLSDFAVVSEPAEAQFTGEFVSDFVGSAFDRADVIRSEHRMRHADGHDVWVETIGRAVRDPDTDAVTELVSVTRDITARKEAELRIRASEEDHRTLFASNPMPMWAFDDNTLTIVAANDAAIALYGYSYEEFLELTVFDLRPPEDAVAVLPILDDLRRGGTGPYHVRHRCKDGHLIDTELSARRIALTGRDNWVVAVKDVTDRRRTEAALRDSHAFVRALVDSSPVAIVATDLDNRVVQWNDAAERLFGWTSAEILGSPYPLAPEEGRADLERLRTRAMRNGRVVDVQQRCVRKDGGVVTVSVSIGAVRDIAGAVTGFVSLVADLTERNKLEAQLRQSQKMEAVGTLAGGVAHDFNNLLTVITSYACMQLAAPTPNLETLRDDLGEIKGAADRATELTRKLLAFSRQQVLEPQVIDLNDVVRGMEPMLRRLLPADITMRTALAADLGVVMADPGQLEQVLMNIVVNARDAMPDGGILTVETMNIEPDPVALLEDSGAPLRVMLAVSDTGSGMSKDVQARIFEPFFTTKESGHGTGLGLSTVHGIVAQSGGTISVYSEPGMGTTFRVCLPRVFDSVSTSPRSAPVAAAPGAGVILLVEDEAPVRVVTTRILDAAGYTVIPTANGVEACEQFAMQGSRVDLVLTDMVMDGMGGRELVERLRALGSTVPVLFMSGYTEQSSRNRNFLDGNSQFIQKPFTPESLTRKVEETLRRTFTAEVA